MAKETGLGITTLSVDDSGGTLRAIINDVTNFSISTPRALQVVTGVDKSAEERLSGMADGKVGLNGVFNDAVTTQSHVVLKNFATVLAGQVGRTVSFSISGQTLSMEMLFEDYALTRAANGDLTWVANASLSDGTVPAWS